MNYFLWSKATIDSFILKNIFLSGGQKADTMACAHTSVLMRKSHMCYLHIFFFITSSIKTQAKLSFAYRNTYVPFLITIPD